MNGYVTGFIGAYSLHFAKCSGLTSASGGTPFPSAGCLGDHLTPRVWCGRAEYIAAIAYVRVVTGHCPVLWAITRLKQWVEGVYCPSHE